MASEDVSVRADAVQAQKRCYYCYVRSTGECSTVPLAAAISHSYASQNRASVPSSNRMASPGFLGRPAHHQGGGKTRRGPKEQDNCQEPKESDEKKGGAAASCFVSSGLPTPQRHSHQFNNSNGGKPTKREMETDDFFQLPRFMQGRPTDARNVMEDKSECGRIAAMGIGEPRHVPGTQQKRRSSRCCGTLEWGSGRQYPKGQKFHSPARRFMAF